MTKRIKTVASFDYRVACGEEKDTLYLTNNSYMYYEDNPSKHIPCDTILWDFGDGRSTSEFSPAPITFDHNGAYEISLQVGNTDFVCDSTVYVTFETGNVSHNDRVDTICDNQLPYIWRGKEYTASGDYYDTLANRWGCDSLLHLSLTVLPTTYSSSIFAIKKGENILWQGDVYTEAGTYTKTLVNRFGCDSIMTLTLTLKEPIYSDTYLTICPGHLPYIWNDILCEAAGDYSASLQTIAGEDSIARLHLIVDSPAQSDTAVVICKGDFPFDWRGKSITTSGIYTDTLSTNVGCDSVVVLTVTETDCSHIVQPDIPLNPMPFVPIRDTIDTIICEGESYALNGIEYSIEGQYLDTGYYWFGWDSVYWTLNLKVKPCECDTAYSTTYKQMKEEELPTFQWNGITVPQVPQSETHDTTLVFPTIKADASCDSIATLHLHIIGPCEFPTKEYPKY